MMKKGIYRSYLKRPMDFTASLLALLFLSPLLIVVGIIVRKNLGSPIIFKQERPGKDEKVFVTYKFRTMTDESDENGELLSNDLRLTKLGRTLRSTSIDELPGFFNILKGDMSLIGPRPLLMEYLPLYNDIQRRRHDVRPGLSGLAQVNGRNTISWEDKFAYDLAYVENITFLGDMKLIFKTFLKVFKRENVNQSETVTMELFKGNEEDEC